MNFSWEKKEHDESDIFEKLICVPLIAYATFYYNRSIYSHVFTSKSQASWWKNLILYSFCFQGLALCSTADLFSFKMTIIRKQKTT